MTDIGVDPQLAQEWKVIKSEYPVFAAAVTRLAVKTTLAATALSEGRYEKAEQTLCDAVGFPPWRYNVAGLMRPLNETQAALRRHCKPRRLITELENCAERADRDAGDPDKGVEWDDAFEACWPGRPLT